jgi:hypothetical protein
VPDEAQPSDPAEDKTVEAPQSPPSRWEKIRPQLVSVLRRVADFLNQLADELT